MKELVRGFVIIALVLGQLALDRPLTAKAATGAVIADVIASDATIGPSVGFDGQFLYYTDYAGVVLHRFDVPPAGGPTTATGKVDVPIVGAPTGIMAITYDATRDLFWAVGGDGLSVYQLNKTGTATLMFVIDPNSDRPGNCKSACLAEVNGFAYDGTDDTLWYSPDGTMRIYHYETYADAFDTAVLASTPYIDIDVAPNDMFGECGYNNSAGVAVGGDRLWLGAGGCPRFFEYTKSGVKVASYAYGYTGQQSPQDFECDNVSYGVPVLWAKDGYSAHFRAFELPAGSSCVYGGGVLVRSNARIRGGGDVLASLPAGATVHHHVSVHCVASVTPNRMSISWKDGSGTRHRFHLLSQTEATCTDDPATVNPPGASFDTHAGRGTGRYDGALGASVDWQLRDGAETGGADVACLRVTDPTGAVVLYVGTGLLPVDCTLPPSHMVPLASGGYRARD